MLKGPFQRNGSCYIKLEQKKGKREFKSDEFDGPAIKNATELKIWLEMWFTEELQVLEELSA